MLTSPPAAPANGRSRDAVALVGVSIVAIILSPFVRHFSAYFSSEPWYLYDDATIAYAAWRFMLGEIPHIHFPYFYAGGYELILGGVFRLFGVSLGTAQWFVSFQMVVSAVLLFALARRCSLNRVVSFVIAIIWGVGGYLLNFHLFPAWLAQTLVLAALVLFPPEISSGSWIRILGVGLLIGLASASKQSVGIFVLLGFASIVPILAVEELPVVSSNSTDGVVRKKRFSLWLLSPMLPPVLVLYVLRNHLTIWNLLLLLTPVFALSTWCLWRVAVFVRHRKGDPLLAGAWAGRVCLSLGGGFAIGLGLLAAYYALHGGLWNFFDESFFKVQAQTTHYFSGINSENLNISESPLLALRRSVVYIVLPLIAFAGFSTTHFVRRQGGNGITSRSILLVSATLIVLNMTLFPNPIRYLFVTVLPLAAIPLAVAATAVASAWIRNHVRRTIAVLGIVLLPIFGYLGARLFTGDLKSFLASDVTQLDYERAQVVLPTSIANPVKPVLDYLTSRPAEERLHSYDLYNKAFAFLSGRTVVHDYGQRFNFYAQSDVDIRRLPVIIETERVDILVVGKAFLRRTRAEEQFFAGLEPDYRCAIETESYLIYQKR